MQVFPLTEAMVEQIAAYIRYTLEKRDPRALIWAAIFFLACAVPAIVIDIILLLARWDGTSPSKALRQRGSRRHRPVDPA